MKIFLAGPFHAHKEHEDWRDFVKQSAPNHEYHDPRIDSEQYVSLTYTRDDLLVGVQTADLVFGYNPRGNYYVDAFGLCIELGFAFAKKIPIVYCDENDWIFPMLPPLAKRLFANLDAAVDYLSRLRDSQDEFGTFYDHISSWRASEDAS